MRAAPDLAGLRYQIRVAACPDISIQPNRKPPAFSAHYLDRRSRRLNDNLSERHRAHHGAPREANGDAASIFCQAHSRATATRHHSRLRDHADGKTAPIRLVATLHYSTDRQIF